MNHKRSKVKQIKETVEEIVFLSLDLLIIIYIYMDAFNLWKFL